MHAVLHEREFGFRAGSPQAAQQWSLVRKKASDTSDQSQGQELEPSLCKVRVTSLHGAGRALGAAAHRGAHGFGRNQVQVLVIGDLVQAVAVLKQLSV